MSGQAPKIFQNAVIMAGIFGGIFLNSCSENSAPKSTSLSSDLGGFNLSTNAFQICNTKESEKETFLKFFSEGGYSIPGDPGIETLSAFFEELSEEYSHETVDLDYSLIKREYHTLTHAMDVMISTHALFAGGAAGFFKTDEKAVILLAALGHDVLHTGVNNGFLAKINHPLIEEFGESGAQEKRSAKFMEELCRKYGILDKSDHKTFNQLSNMLRQSILWTDFSRHQELMTQVEKLISKLETPTIAELKEGINPSSILNSDERILLGSFILHCADVSNPGKDWAVCERWANLVMNEFFAQGDLEKSLKMKPSMNCDRETVSIAKCQIGFGQFVVKDLFKLLEKVSPEGGRILSKNLQNNQNNWKAILEKN